MTASRDPDRRIHAFLVEGRYELADRVYDAVRGETDVTRQRVVIVPWRTPQMTRLARIAIAVAAVVGVATVGYNLLPGPGTGPGGEASPSTLPPPSPSPAAAFPLPGPLAVGRYPALLEGVSLSFELATSGWSANPYDQIEKGTFAQPGGSTLIFWGSAPDSVYSDPCAHTPLNPAPAANPEALAAAVSTLPGTDLVAGPSSLTIDGHPAQHVAIRIRDDIGCDPAKFYRWYDDNSGGPTGGYRNGSDFGATIWVWIIDGDGKPLWIDGETYQGADPQIEQELQQIIGSIRFE